MHTTTLFHKIISAALLICAIGPLTAAPKLTVVVTVDGLNESNLQRMRSYWPQGGLRTLSEEAYQTTLTFPHAVYGGGETAASLLTGLLPRQNGYAMDMYFSRTDRKIHSLLQDEKEKGIGTKTPLSPRALLGTTITDELRMREGSKANIYAIGVNAEHTILLAGHAANACCWIDEASQHWVSTSFYTEGLPSEADKMNVGGRFAEIASKVWTPRMDINMYLSPTSEERKHSFSYESAKQLTKTPAANTLVIELALAIQKAEHLGEDKTPDMLLLNLHTNTPSSTSDQITTAEQEDLYLWLNQDLGYLMEQLGRRIGKNSYEVLLVGLPSRGISDQTMKLAGIEKKEFNVDRAAALTGTYLMALYGHERWIDGGYGNAIYLNRNLIEQKRLSLESLQRQVANFLMEFEGIEIALPANEAISHPDLMNSISKKTMGDVVFRMSPGWQLMTDDKTTLDNVVEQNPTAPLMLWSGNIRQWPTNAPSILDIKNMLE